MAPFVELNYKIIGNCNDAGVGCSAVCERPVTVHDIKNKFAFEGEYMFRARVLSNVLGCGNDGYVWLDLQHEADAKYINDSISNQNRVEIHALLLSIPHSIEIYVDNASSTNSGYDEYFSNMNDIVGNGVTMASSSSPSSSNSHSLSKSGAKFFHNVVQSANSGVHSIANSVKTSSKNLHLADNVNVQSVSKGMNSLWNSVKSVATTAATQIQQNLATLTESSTLTDEIGEYFGDLSDDVSAPFNAQDPRHMALLQDLWKAMCAASSESNDRPTSLERESLKWKDMGFQTKDPVADLKSSGVLALRTLEFMLRKHKAISSRLISQNKANLPTNYPFAIVGVNLTLLLADILKLKQNL